MLYPLSYGGDNSDATNERAGVGVGSSPLRRLGLNRSR